MGFLVKMTNAKSHELINLYPNIGDPNVKTEDGETSLHIACYYGRLKIVELLVVCSLV